MREKRLRQYLTAQGIDCRLAAYYDQAGHLRLELEGRAGPPRTEEGTAKLSKLVNFPLGPWRRAAGTGWCWYRASR